VDDTKTFEATGNRYFTAFETPYTVHLDEMDRAVEDITVHVLFIAHRYTQSDRQPTYYLLNRRERHPGGWTRSLSVCSWLEAVSNCVRSPRHTAVRRTKSILAELTADTRLLETTEWHLVMECVVGVDPNLKSALVRV